MGLGPVGDDWRLPLSVLGLLADLENAPCAAQKNDGHLGLLFCLVLSLLSVSSQVPIFGVVVVAAAAVVAIAFVFLAFPLWLLLSCPGSLGLVARLVCCTSYDAIGPSVLVVSAVWRLVVAVSPHSFRYFTTLL